MYCLVWPGLWQWLQSPVAFWLLLDAASSTTTDVARCLTGKLSSLS